MILKKPLNDRIIIGIDPGTQLMGYGLLKVEGCRLSMLAMGVIHLNKYENHYLKLAKIHSRITGLIEEFLPDEMAIEAPFYGKNVQSMLKLGRAQGVAMAAAIAKDVPISEYAPLKIKMAITGNGRASKEQVSYMLQKILKFDTKNRIVEYDATDALAAAVCHYYQSVTINSDSPQYKDWTEYALKNKDKIK